MNTYDIFFNTSSALDNISKAYYVGDAEESIGYLPAFNSINIIIGANNSGKSRFMRFLMSQNEFQGLRNLKKFNEIIESYNLVVDEFNTTIIDDYLHKANNGVYFTGDSSQKRGSFVSHRLKKLDDSSFNILDTIELNKQNMKNLGHFRDSRGALIKNVFISDFTIEENFFKNFKGFKKYFIPTLRTAHSLFKKGEGYKKIEEDIYLDTLNKYYSLEKLDVSVFTGIHLHKEILNTRNSKRSIRESFEKFEKFISKHFFSGRQIDIVAEFNKDESLQGLNHSEIISVHIEGERDTRDLHDLGDGIQAIIVLMYKIFTAEPHSFIFIDEPEINLHPGMQRLFLDQICNNIDLKQKDLTYIIATHSNHFLDLTLRKQNISIYSFSPKTSKPDEKQFIIRNVNNGDNSLLKNLGVNNSSVFLANCGIWVEGVSDRNFIKAFLKSYVTHLNLNEKERTILREDIDFAFFEYAGSNLEHYMFNSDYEAESTEEIISNINALALNNRIYLLADSDCTNKNSKKGIRLKRLEKNSSNNFHAKIIWEVREIENLLTNEIWQEVLLSFCNKTLVKSAKDQVLSEITKALNEINSQDYKKEYIGNFLADVNLKMNKIKGINILNQSIYEVKASGVFGTFIPKMKLSEVVLQRNFPWEVFAKNKLIVTLTKEIFDFINHKDL